MSIRPRYMIGTLLALGLAFGIVGAIAVGSEIARPSQAVIGPAPRSLHAEDVQFRSDSGCLLKGWLIHGLPGSGALVLMHGIHSNRLSMLSRARFLSEAGYSVLLFNFQAHGESIGEHQTFGYLESSDARAACAFLRSQLPNERIGVLGSSLGGAAAILGREPLRVQALVVEAVYPTIEEATSNRIAMRLGAPGRLLSPLLTSQLRLRLGILPEDLRPIDRIPRLKAPLFMIAGGEDQDTTPEESRRLFQAAPGPKQYWEIGGAGHTDFHAHERGEYEKRVLEFFQRIRERRAARQPRETLMMRSKTPWVQKLRPEMSEKVVDDPRGRGKMLVPTPLLVAEELRRVKRGHLITPARLRQRLASRFGADVTCPLTTGIFLNILAGAAEEQLAKGKPVVAPYWRVVDDSGYVSPRTPPGPKRQAIHLRREGHSVKQLPGGRGFRVQEYENRLV